MNERRSRLDSPEYENARRTVRASAARALEIADRVYGAAEAIITSGTFTATKTRGLSRGPVVVTLGLLTKALKTFRAVRATQLEGCGQDAAVLVRSLFETATAVLWVLQRSSRHRSRLYVAHQDQRVLVQLEEMAKTPGLKRRSTPSLLSARAQAASLSKYLSPADVASVRRHWSGLPGGIEATARRLAGNGWMRVYNTVYREASGNAHGADAAQHAFFSETKPFPVFKLLPGDESAERNLIVAALLLHAIASRMDKRMGLGHSEEFTALCLELKAWRPSK